MNFGRGVCELEWGDAEMLLLLLLRTPDMPTNANDWITIYLGYIQITTNARTS